MWPSGNAGAATDSLSEQDRIEAAIPTKALVPPRKPRKLLIFDLNVGYGGHASIRTANAAFTRMGQKTGAFATVVSRDPSIFRPDSLRQFDAVFFNNNVGNLFTDPALRQSLIEFVYGGGGLLGVHGTTVAFTRWTEGAREDWPEFGIMLGGRGANHKANDEHVFIRLDDPGHPVNQPFGGRDFEYRSEFFRVHGPYSRDRVRVLLSIDTQKTDMQQAPAYGQLVRADNDYALAWVRNYGRGRVFYCTIAHQPSIFWDPRMLQFYLAAVQFALGDLPAPTTPSSKLTPAVKAQEKLGWRLGVEADTFPKHSLFEAIDKTSQLGLSYLGGSNAQKVSPEIPKSFGLQLTDEELKQVRLKLDAGGVRLLTYRMHPTPTDPAGWRRVFEFGRKIGIETLVADPPGALDTIERCCEEFGINVALGSRDREAAPQPYRHPAGPRIGAWADLGDWMRSGVDPLEAARMLKDRLIAVQLPTLPESKPTGADRIEPFLREISRLGVRPTMFSIGCSGSESLPEMVRSIEGFNRITLELTK
jgi:type 1 glutamine amidotransferase